MIKLESTSVMNLENAIRGARNPMNSWARSDSFYNESGEYILGENDLSLATRLCKAGSDHRKFMRQIIVSVDITAPLYWWKEFDTYKVGTVANSCSTMHKIHAKGFELADFSCEHLFDSSLCALEDVICKMNFWRKCFIEQSNPETRKEGCRSAKECWWQMIQLLPTSYNQLRTVTLNYEVLTNMYHARENHKLDEWHTFCAWAESLPYAKELIVGAT